MDRESMLEALKTGIKEYTQQIEELEAEREVARKMLLRFSSNGQTEIKEIVLDSHSVKIGPTLAMKELFEGSPQRKWKAPELRDKLQNMKDSGVLESNAQNLLTTVYYLLKRLCKRGYIEKYSAGQRSWYRKINVEN